MTREEYVERMEREDDWAPGWDAIDREFDRGNVHRALPSLWSLWQMGVLTQAFTGVL